MAAGRSFRTPEAYLRPWVISRAEYEDAELLMALREESSIMTAMSTLSPTMKFSGR